MRAAANHTTHLPARPVATIKLRTVHDAGSSSSRGTPQGDDAEHAEGTGGDPGARTLPSTSSWFFLCRQPTQNSAGCAGGGESLCVHLISTCLREIDFADAGRKLSASAASAPTSAAGARPSVNEGLPSSSTRQPVNGHSNSAGSC